MVVPGSEVKKIDEWGLFKSKDIEDGLRKRLDEIICLPHFSVREDLSKTDFQVLRKISSLYGEGGITNVMKFNEPGK